MKSESIDDIISYHSVKPFREFDDPHIMSAADALKLIQRHTGEVDIANSMSKSSKAIDDLIDFKPPILPNMTKPGSSPTYLKKAAMDPFLYDKLKTNKEPRPIIIVPELTPNKRAEDLVKAKQVKDDNTAPEREPIQKSESEIRASIALKSQSKFTKKQNSPEDIIGDDSTDLTGLEEQKSIDENQRSKFMNLCTKGEWGNVELLLRSYSKENPLPKFKDLVNKY